MQDILTIAIEVIALSTAAMLPLQFARFVARRSPRTVRPVDQVVQRAVPSSLSPQEADALLDKQLTQTLALQAVPAAIASSNDTHALQDTKAEVTPAITAADADACLDTQLLLLTRLDSVPGAIAVRKQRTARQSPGKSKRTTRSAAKAQHNTASLTVPIAKKEESAQPTFQINLQEVTHQNFRGETHIDIACLPIPLPEGIKHRSVYGKYRGVKVSDLEEHGFIIFY